MLCQQRRTHQHGVGHGGCSISAGRGIAACLCPGPRKQGWTGLQQQLFGVQVPMSDTFLKPWHGLADAVVTNLVTWQHGPDWCLTWPWDISTRLNAIAGAQPELWPAAGVQRHLGRGFIGAEHPTYRSNRCSKHWQSPKKVTGRATLQSVKALGEKKKVFVFSSSEKGIRPHLFRKLTLGTLMWIL